MIGMKEGPSPTSRKYSQPSVLNQVLQEAWDYSQTNRQFLAVFDLDSTLFDLTLRVMAIVDDFRNSPENQALYPNECQRLEQLKILKADWGLQTPLERAGINCEGPFFKAIHEFWANSFFSNHYLGHDEPLPGAVTFVQELHLVGAKIMYLTGRDVPRMLEGTRLSLKEHGFPVDPPAVDLILKPDARMDDALFKTQIIRDQGQQFERIWLFENEPVNLNLVARECPDVKLVFIDSTHSGREELTPSLDRIIHFECDLKEFRQIKGL